jgi:N-acetylmuramate 1-kinase
MSTEQQNLMTPTAKKFLADAIGTDDFEVIQLAGDASSRRYARIVHKDTSNVLMLWEPFVDDGNYPFLNVLQHFSKHGVQVPQVVAKAPALGLVLLEDLGDLTLERKFWENQNHLTALPYYKLAIDELIKMHYPSSRDTQANCVAFKVAFNTEKLLWEMNYGLEHLIEKFCKVKLADATKRELQNTFTGICAAFEKFICHRDYHSRNVMIKLGKTRIIDFQDARMGSIQYDLVSLVHDSYVDMNESMAHEILEYYISKSRDYRTEPIQRDHFYSVMRVQTIQRCFKACGSFASFFNMREDTRYLKYLKPTIHKVAQIAEQYPAYKTFHSVIQDNGLLEKDYLKP